MSPAPGFSRLLRPLLRSRNPWVRGSTLAVLVLMAAWLALQKTTTKPSALSTRNAAASPLPHSGAYETLTGVRLVEHRNNDGDSFRVRQGGREFELRLYFVDTPEKYWSDRYPDQQARVKDQARDLGLSIDQTLALGVKARDFVRELLSRQPFTVYTKWETVYDSERIHGFVELPDPDRPGQTVYLCELLMRRGLGRVHTKGAPAPDGRGEQEYRQLLLRMRDMHPASRSLPGKGPSLKPQA